MADNEKDTKNGLPEAIDTETILDTAAQITIAEKLQAGLLRTYLHRLQRGTISDTGLAALQRLLQANGWSLDPKQVPQELANLLTSSVDPNELDDEDVLPFQRKA